MSALRLLRRGEFFAFLVGESESSSPIFAMVRSVAIYPSLSRYLKLESAIFHFFDSLFLTASSTLVGEEYTFLGKSDVVTGLISTNYGEIPLSFPRLSGLTVKSQIIRDDLGGFDEFFLDGGYILLDFYFENNLLMEDSIRFDIIAPSEDIEAWESRGLK